MCAVCAAVTVAASAQTFTLLDSFDFSNGSRPGYETLAQGRDGNLYGTTNTGGADNFGVAFRISPQGALTVLASFDITNGANPFMGFALGPNGLLYGTTFGGGPLEAGSIYSLSDAGAITVLYNFDAYPNPNTPLAPLLSAADGNYYGTTQAGGANNQGVVFKITPSGAFSVVYNFSGYNVYPRLAGLVQGQNGALYGVTVYGGPTDNGTIYEVTTSGRYKTLHNFPGGKHGANPQGALVLGADGNFYGTTVYGGDGDQGTIFSMTASGVVTVLHSFTPEDGTQPYANLVQATDGKFYGTTAAGGHYGDGTLFSFTATGTFTKLHDFDGADGSSVECGLVQHTNGKFYGVAAYGGASNDGTVFSLDVGLGPFVSFLRNFGKVGSSVQIFGDNLAGSTGVTFNGTAATFTVVSNTFIKATVPSSATSGPVQVTTPGGVLTSNVNFTVTP